MNNEPTNDLCVSAEAQRPTRAGWHPLVSNEYATRYLTISWWSGLTCDNTFNRVRTLLNESQFEGAEEKVIPGATAFRAKVSASHTTDKYPCCIVILDNGKDWGSFCACPSGARRYPLCTHRLLLFDLLLFCGSPEQFEEYAAEVLPKHKRSSIGESANEIRTNETIASKLPASTVAKLDRAKQVRHQEYQDSKSSSKRKQAAEASQASGAAGSSSSAAPPSLPALIPASIPLVPPPSLSVPSSLPSISRTVAPAPSAHVLPITSHPSPIALVPSPPAAPPPSKRVHSQNSTIIPPSLRYLLVSLPPRPTASLSPSCQ